MGASNQDLHAEQGATFVQTLTLKDSTNVAIDLTGDTFRGKVRKTISDTAEIAVFTCTLKNQTTNTGQVEIKIPAATMAAIELKAQKTPTRTEQEFCYDIEWVKADGTVLRILQGKFLISPEVTR